MKRKSLFAFKSIVIAFTLICFFIVKVAFAQKFTIPILPDTQCEVNYNPAMFTSQMKWIADKKDSLNMPIVLHVGDLVDFNSIDQYNRASEGFKILDNARIPYAITLGNHDTDAVGEHSGSAASGNVNANLRNTDRFNTYFPVKRFTSQKGRFEKNKSDNAFYTFKAGGLNWLVLTLEFCSRPVSVEWAGLVISKHPKHNVIILTHYHLNAKGIIGQDNAGYGDLSPQEVYDQLIKLYANVRIVLSGHTGSSVHRDDIGLKGNHIYQILQDYQGEDNGGGFIRLLEIDPELKTMYAKMYSPFYNRTKTDSSQFSFAGVNFVGNK
ncbi:MAG TPA: metallophosphoesterase [Prolixibacteraceae bacterium]|nr:metallophosphoesterase [Prolixibacteraceae bacterium]